MLDEAQRRRARGADVVIALVEDHGRPLTAQMVRDLETIPRARLPYRGADLAEMDLAALLERQPEVALIDELAHTNVPGSLNEKRYQDVTAVLDAGINVITTVNIQHVESLATQIAEITGVSQRETLPDWVLRGAGQIELVDITPEALIRRAVHGNVVAPDMLDTALSNYFRIPILTALRSLTLLWLATSAAAAPGTVPTTQPGQSPLP
jgi:two-component system sensor histidine kinase KdpD